MFAKDMKMSLLVRQYKQNWKKNGIMKNCDGVFLLTHQKMSFKKRKKIITALILVRFFFKMVAWMTALFELSVFYTIYGSAYVPLFSTRGS